MLSCSLHPSSVLKPELSWNTNLLMPLLSKNLQRLLVVHRRSQNSFPWCSYSSSSLVFQFHIQSLSTQPHAVVTSLPYLLLPEHSATPVVNANAGLSARDWTCTFTLTPWLANSYLFFKPSSSTPFVKLSSILPRQNDHLMQYPTYPLSSQIIMVLTKERPCLSSPCTPHASTSQAHSRYGIDNNSSQLLC